MADVEIMLEQLKRIFQNEDIVKQIRVSKLNRTVARLTAARKGADCQNVPG